jgi:hypothetical protein
MLLLSMMMGMAGPPFNGRMRSSRFLSISNTFELPAQPKTAAHFVNPDGIIQNLLRDDTPGAPMSRINPQSFTGELLHSSEIISCHGLDSHVDFKILLPGELFILLEILGSHQGGHVAIIQWSDLSLMANIDFGYVYPAEKALPEWEAESTNE